MSSPGLRSRSLPVRIAVCFVAIEMAACGVVEKVTKKGGASKTSEAADSSEVPLPNDGLLLEATDLAVAPGFVLDPYTQAQLLYELNTTSDFYNAQPEPATKSEFIKCIDDKFKDATAKANKVSVVIKFETDVSDCLRIVLTSDDYLLKSVQGKNRHYYYGICEGSDVSTMNGFKWASSENSQVKCPKIIELTQTITDAVIEYEVDGVVIKKTQRTLTHQGNAKLAGCTSTQNGDIATIGDDCIKISKLESTTTTSIDTPRSIPVKKFQWTKLKYNGISGNAASKDHVWFSSGSISLEMNGWLGTINYKDSKTAPGFTMLNAVTGAAADGDLIAMPSEL